MPSARRRSSIRAGTNVVQVSSACLRNHEAGTLSPRSGNDFEASGPSFLGGLTSRWESRAIESALVREFDSKDRVPGRIMPVAQSSGEALKSGIVIAHQQCSWRSVSDSIHEESSAIIATHFQDRGLIVEGCSSASPISRDMAGRPTGQQSDTGHFQVPDTGVPISIKTSAHGRESERTAIASIKLGDRLIAKLIPRVVSWKPPHRMDNGRRNQDPSHHAPDEGLINRPRDRRGVRA